MVKLVNQTIFSAKIREKNIPIFAAGDVRALFGLSPVATSALLHRYKKRGFIMQIKRGLYTLSDAHIPDLYLANKLYEPSYISLEFALSYHRVVPETVYEITSVTPKGTRRFQALGKIYSYRKIRQAAFTGYTIEKQQGLSFQIADPEKAFIDTNYFRMLSRLEPISRYDKEKIDLSKALRYTELFENKKLMGIIKRTLR